MRAFGCSAKSRKLSGVGSPDELPKTTIVPFASTRAIAAASDAPPAASRISAKRPRALSMPSTISSAPRRCRPRSGLADDGGDVGPRPRGDLGGEVPDPAGGAGDQHPLAEQRRAVAQGAQRRQAGDRQGRGILEAGIRRAMPPCGEPGTAARCAQPALSVNATTRVPALGPAAVCRRAAATTPLMSWPGRQPSGRVCISRNSPRFSENARTSTSASFGRRLRLRHLAQFDRRGAVRGVDQGQHRILRRAPHPPRCARHPLPRCGRGAIARPCDLPPAGEGLARRAWWVRGYRINLSSAADRRCASGRASIRRARPG